MKAKLFFSTMALAALMAATGCSDEEVVTSSAGNKEWEGTATISGVIYVDSNVTSEENKNEPAGGAKIAVTYNTADLTLYPAEDVKYSKKVIRTTADANGNFSVTVPACMKEVSYTVSFEAFESQYNDGKKVKKGYFPEFTPPAIFVKKGGTTFVTKQYGGFVSLENDIQASESDM